MNKTIKKLIDIASSVDNPEKAGEALGDLGLLVERHTQNRYSEQDYLILLGNNTELFDLHLEDEDVETLTRFFFFHILNIHIHPVTVAWCLGKCYNMDILEGMKRLLDLFHRDDQITLQLIYSIISLFGFEKIKNEIFVMMRRNDLPNTVEYLQELSNEGFFDKLN